MLTVKPYNCIIMLTSSTVLNPGEVRHPVLSIYSLNHLNTEERQITVELLFYYLY